jgi:hypothetical protein
MKLWWLSFADGARPAGEQFLGAAIVPGEDIIAAVQAAHAAGCNPGGEVCGLPIPQLLASRLEANQIGRLMQRDEAEGVFGS